MTKERSIGSGPRVVRFELSLKSIAAVVFTLIILWTLGQLIPIFIVLGGALILAGTLNRFVALLEKRRMKRPWAIALVFGVCIIVVALLALIIVPALWSEISSMIQHLPAFQTKAAEVLSRNRMTAPLADTVRHFGIAKAATGDTLTSAVALSVGVLSAFGYAGTSIVLAIYFIADYERMRGVLYAFVPRRFHVRLARVMLNLEPIVGGYLRGQLITSVAITIFTFALLSVAHVHSALALSAFAGLTDVIPFVGGLLATAPAVLLGFGKSVPVAISIFVAMMVYQEFESRIIVPRVYGNALRLPAATVVIALLVGGKLGGILGALLALPVAAALRMLIKELRFELPGDDTDDSAIRHRDEKDERAYEKQSAGTDPIKAASIATSIAKKSAGVSGEESSALEPI